MTVATAHIKPKSKYLDLCMYPNIRRHLKAAFAEVRKLNPNISGYVGHDGERMFFQEFANATTYSIPLSFVDDHNPQDDHFA